MLRGKIALITGSAKGLGKMTALALARDGCDIVINYVNSKEAAEQLVSQIEDIGVRAMAVRADVSHMTSWCRWWNRYGANGAILIF